MQNSWVWKIKPKQLPKSPTNSLASCYQEGVKPIWLFFRRPDVANCHVIPELLLSAKHAEAGPYGLTTKYIHNICQEKPGWVSKVIKQPREEKYPLKAFCLTKGRNQEGPPKMA